MTDFAELAARALRNRPAVTRGEPSRDDSVAAVAGALARRTRRATWRARLVRGGLFAAAAAAVLGIGSFVGGKALPRCPAGLVCAKLELSDGRSSPFDPGAHVAVAPRSSGAVSFESGTRIVLDEKSTFEYREGARTRRFGLLHGAAHVHVVKLSPGERFVVETRDAEVEVKGTVFDVFAEERPECGELTRVTVREGVVEVRAHGRTFRVPAGHGWPEGCTAPASIVPAAPAPTAAPERETSLAPRAGHAPAAGTRIAAQAETDSISASPKAAAPESVAASDLAEQNRMFAEAMQARRSGRLASALASYEEFLAKYPSGPLSESARVERLRILAQLDPSRARILAERYLVDYPRGFARTEARAIAEP